MLTPATVDFLDPVNVYLLLVASPLGHHLFHFHFYVLLNVAHNHSVVITNFDMVDDCCICDDVGLFVRTKAIPIFVTPFGLSHIHHLPSLF